MVAALARFQPTLLILGTVVSFRRVAIATAAAAGGGGGGIGEDAAAAVVGSRLGGVARGLGTPSN